MFRKVTVFTAILLAAVLGTRAQSTDTLSVEILFSQLDTSRISTGILMDKVLPAGPHFYSSNGVNPEAPVLGCFAALDNLWLLRQGTVKDTLMPFAMMPHFNLFDCAPLALGFVQENPTPGLFPGLMIAPPWGFF